MAKRNRKKRGFTGPTAKKANPTKKRTFTINEVVMLRLKASVLRRENNQLKRERLELRQQLNKVQLQVIQLQSTIFNESLEKSDKELEENWTSQLDHLKEEYGIDLNRDKVDLTTGVITWGDSTKDPKPSLQSVPSGVELEEDETTDLEELEEDEEEDEEENEEKV